MSHKKSSSEDLAKAPAKSRKLTHNGSDSNNAIQPFAVPRRTGPLADRDNHLDKRIGFEHPQSSSALQQDDLRMTGQSSPTHYFDGADDLHPENDTNLEPSDMTSDSGRTLRQNKASMPNMSQPFHPHADGAGPSGASGKRHVHKASGYEWEKEEDAPGYSWKNRKAREEQARALEQIVDKDKIIGRMYGDIGLEDFDEKA